MKMNKKIIFLSVFVIMILTLPHFADAIAPGSRWYVTGRVMKSGTSTPISGATVRISNDGAYRGTVYTSSTGSFSYSTTTRPTNYLTGWEVTVSKSGYVTTTRYAPPEDYITNMGTIYMTIVVPPPPPPAPTQPIINDVQVDIGDLKQVTVSWDVSWGSTATSWSSQCWWSLDSNIDTSDSIYTSSSSTTHHSVTVPQDRLTMSSNTYWFKIQAINSNSGGSSQPAVYGPQSMSISSWRVSPIDDAFTYAETPYTNYYSNPTWYNKIMVATGDTESPGLFYGWLKFNLQYPNQVKSAILRLHDYSTEPNGHGTISAYQCGTNWEEETITYDNSHNSVSIGPLLATDTAGSAGTWDAWNVILAASGESTFAVYLAPSGGQLHGAHYYSKEHETTSLRPYLEIEYVDYVFQQDCSSIDNWFYHNNYYDIPYTPLSYTEISSNYKLTSSDGLFHLYENYGVPGALRGAAYHLALDQEIALSNLASFDVSMNYNYQSDFRQGNIIVALYDSDYISNYQNVMTKPIIVTEIFVETEYGDSPKMSINAYYVDENLNEYFECLASQISQSWSGIIKFWYDTDGIWVKLSSNSPILLANWKIANMRREAAYVVVQGGGTGSPIPALSIDNIEVLTNSAFNQFIDLQTPNELRSGPKDIGITKPGPTNELQFFPLDGNSLEFKFYRTAAYYDILLDLRAVPFAAPPPSNPTIEIKVNDEVIDNYQVTVDPVQQLPTANYLHESRWTSTTMGYVSIELTVSGWSSSEGAVALRGIWVMRDLGADFRFLENLEQVFPSSGELIYYIPMGSETSLDIDWEGDNGIEVSVDNHVVTWTDQKTTSISLGSFSRGALRELKIKHTGILHMQSGISIMHTRHFWMNIEVDFIDYTNVDDEFPGESTFRTRLQTLWSDIQSYYEEHTHGFIRFEIGDNILYDPSKSDGYFVSDLVNLGEQYFDSIFDRDYIWAVYIEKPLYIDNDQTKIAGGIAFTSDDNGVENNGRMRWTALTAQWFGSDAITYHELGHRAHIHEGGNPPTEDGEICTYGPCPMGPEGNEIGYCQFHWFQTWYNTRFQTTVQPSHPPHWRFDWWLI